MKDLIVPIVFPDYRISVNTPAANIDVLPWVNFDNFTIAASNRKFSNLGHAGILLAQGATGITKYYEYGRYDAPENKGIVRRIPIPDVQYNSKNIILKSLANSLHRISQVAGQGGRIQGVIIEASNVFTKLNQLILTRKLQNNDSHRKPYDLATNSCIHFVKWVVASAGQKTPWMADPRPNSYIGEFRDEYRDLDYFPKSKSLRVEAAKELAL